MVGGKTVFVNADSDIHIGMAGPAGFKEGTATDIEKALKALAGRKLWRCNVCYDLHINTEPPEECPTCHFIDPYVEINEKEFREMMSLWVK